MKLKYINKLLRDHSAHVRNIRSFNVLWFTKMPKRTDLAPVNVTRSIFLLTCQLLIMEIEANPVYTLTFETCGGRISGTDSKVRVHLYNANGSRIGQTFDGQGELFNLNMTDVFRLNETQINDVGPICRVDLQLVTSGKEVWRLKRLLVRHSFSQDVGIFIVNKCDDDSSYTSGVALNYSRQTPQWESWGACICETETRQRIRKRSLCEQLRPAQSESQHCRSSFSNCFDANLLIFFCGLFGFIIILLVVFLAIYCERRRRRNSSAEPKIPAHESGSLTSPEENTSNAYETQVDMATPQKGPLPPVPDAPPPLPISKQTLSKASQLLTSLKTSPKNTEVNRMTRQRRDLSPIPEAPAPVPNPPVPLKSPIPCSDYKKTTGFLQGLPLTPNYEDMHTYDK